MNVKFLSSRHQRLPKRQSAARLRKSGRIDDWQLLDLERTLTKELGGGDLEVTRVAAGADGLFESLLAEAFS